MSDQPPVGPDRPTPPSADGPPPWGAQQQQQGPYGGQPPQQGPYAGQPPQQQGPYAGQAQAPYGPPVTQGRRRSKTPAIIAVVLAAVLVLAGGGAFAYTQIGGGGKQPAEALPGNAFAYYRMDIDPSLGQKVAAVRFMSKFPTSEGDFTTGDIRKKLWAAAKEDNPSIKDIDYDRDIKPWLGDRMGMSLSAPPRQGDDPMVAMALQVKDEDKAREGIDKILAALPEHPSASFGASAPIPGAADGSDKPAYFFHGDYAVFTTAEQRDAVKAAIEEGPLSENTTFSSDMDDLGEQGILSGWVDAGAMGAKALGMMAPGAGSQLQRSAEQLGKSGRFAVALRFDSDYLELAGITRGQDWVKAPKDPVDGAITSLPDDTAVALSLSNGDEMIGSSWDALMKVAKEQSQQRGSSQSPQQFIDQFKESYGISLPEDLQTLIGSNLVIAAPDQEFENVSGPDDVIAGVRVKTDPAKAEDVMTKLEKLARDQGTELPIVHRADGDSFLAAVGQPGLDWIGKDGKLGDTDAFQLAVPDAKTAQWVTYVDLDKLEHHYLGQIHDKETREFVKSLRSFGMTAHMTGDGEGDFSIRLVGN